MSHKVVVVGDSGVGKTTIISAGSGITIDELNLNSMSKAALGTNTKIVKKVKNEEVELDVWDTLGTPTYQSVASNISKDAIAFICVFDVTNELSLDNISAWLNMVNYGEKQKYVFLVGNKTDLVQNYPEITTLLQLEEYFNKNRKDEDKPTFSKQKLLEAIGKKELIISNVSAEKKTGIDELFQSIANTLHGYDNKTNKEQSACCLLI